MSNAFLLTALLITPFLGALIISLIRFTVQDPHVRERLTRFITITSSSLNALLAVWSFFQFNGATIETTLFTWIDLGDFSIGLTLLLDPLSLIMVLFISLISMFIFIYATGYMHLDIGYARFFIYFHLFLGSMLLLVLANDPVIMFLGWEGVGVCSYLLIGYYFKDQENIKAANKAFYLNRIGDFGLVSALGLLFVSMGSNGMDFSAIQAHISTIDSTTLTAIGILLFVGAMGKSAQIPLYVWLPDAMAGPTPVSALIHAATMVTAGVYMVVRFAFLYKLIPDVGLFIATIGAVSALVAALFASFEEDIKKILAYSTMSQLGYMFVGAGLGLYSGAIYHLFNHAFFKALLFMGAGAVIVALHHQQNIFKMGNMRLFLPAVFISMFFATAAISGIAPFSGFFSKDALIAQAFFTHHYVLFTIVSLTAFLTAYYMFRLFFTVFIAPSSKDRAHIEFVPISMQWPLLLLALAATVNGVWNLPHFMGGSAMMSHFLDLPDTLLHASVHDEWILSVFNTLVAFLGMFIAYKRFASTPTPADPSKRFSRWSIHKFYIDELYYRVFVQSLHALSQSLIHLIEPLIIATVNRSVQTYRQMSKVIDSMQTGNASHYLAYIMFGVSMLSLYLYLMIKGLA